MQCPSDAKFVVRSRLPPSTLFHVIRSIRHHDGEACEFEHAEVVVIIANGDHLIALNTPMGRPAFYRVSFTTILIEHVEKAQVAFVVLRLQNSSLAEPRELR